MIPSIEPATAGILLALCGAITWSISVISFRRSQLRTADLNLTKNVLALGVVGVIMVALGQQRGLPTDLTSWIKLLLSGVLGMALGDGLVTLSIRRLQQASRYAIVASSYTPIVALATYVFLGERISAAQMGGLLAVAMGVLISARSSTSGHGLSLRDFVTGMAAGTLANLCFAGGVVTMREPLAGLPVTVASWIRLLGGTIAALIISASCRGRRCVDVLRQPHALASSLPSAIAAGVLCPLAFLAGIKLSSAAAIAASLSATSLIWTSMLAVLFLHERWSRRKSFALALTSVGLAVLVLGSQ